MKTNFRISQYLRFLLRPGYSILVKIWKWLKLLNSVPLIKKTRRNHVHNWSWSFWLTLTVLQWMKTNLKLVKYLKMTKTSFFCSIHQENTRKSCLIWNLKFLNSVPDIKKTQLNHVWNRIWSFWLSFTVLQWMKRNLKMSQFSRFLLRPGYSILVKNWLKMTETS